MTYFISEKSHRHTATLPTAHLGSSLSHQVKGIAQYRASPLPEMSRRTPKQRRVGSHRNKKRPRFSAENTLDPIRAAVIVRRVFGERHHIRSRHRGGGWPMRRV